MSKVDRPLRILHLTAASDAGGLSRYIFDLCSAMQAMGHQTAVAGDVGAWHALFESAPFPWIHAPLKHGLPGLIKARRILDKWLTAHPIDILHCHYRKPVLVARRLQRAHPAPLLYTLHLSHISLAGPRRWFTDFGDHVHVASAQAREWIIEEARVPAEKVTLIPHGIDPDKFPLTTEQSRDEARRVLKLAPTDLLALFVGRFDVPKNESWLIDLAGQTRESHPDLRIILCGEGPHENVLRERIAKENLAQRVTLIKSEKPLPLFQAADAFLLPSSREGFSLACAEAMSTGLPVLRTRTSGTQELIIEQQTGVSVPIDRDAFLVGAKSFLSDPIKLKQVGTAAAEHIRTHFTFDRQLRETIELYRRLI